MLLQMRQEDIEGVEVIMETEKKRPPSLEVPAIRLDPETHALVRAEMRRRAIETGETPRYGDVVRGLVRRALVPRG